MNTLLIRSLTGGVVVAFVIAMFVKNYIDGEDLNHLRPLATESKVSDATDYTKITDLQNVLDTAIKDVKALNVELTEIKSKLTTLKTEHKKFETDVLAKISRFDHASVLGSSSSIAVEQDSDLDGEPIEVQDNAVDDDALQVDRIAKMDDTLYMQEFDPAWDDKAAGQITNSFSNAGFEQSQLQGVVCQGIICRVEINEDNAISELFDGDQQLIPWSHKGRIETIENESGNLTTVMYITREDYDFPHNF